MKLKQIMLIDDNYIDNYIAKKVIENENVVENITVQESPLEALEYLKNKENAFPELIFLDIKMPIMNGFEFLEEFAKLSNHEKSTCHIVILSSSNNFMDIEAAENNPFVLKYLSKPLTSANLINSLVHINNKK